MDYFVVSIIEYPNVRFEDSNYNYYSETGDLLYNIKPPTHYIFKEPVLTREEWMAPAKVVVTSRLITPLAFLELFTQSERATIRSAAKQSPALEDFLELLKIAQAVDLDYPTTVSGVYALEAAQLLAPGRAKQILGV